MKSRILETARNQFNAKGFSRVSLRMIADEIGISPGNLTYHFKKKDDLVMALYEEMVEQLNESMGQALSARDELLEKMIETTWLYFKLSWEYRFFMIEWVFFMREYPIMQENHKKLMELRTSQFKFSFESFRQQQMMQPEMEEGLDDSTLHNMFLIGNFWISQEISLNDRSTDEAISSAVKTIIGVLKPLFEPAYREDLTNLMYEKKPVI